jgi:hypothetical protein
VTSGNFRGPNVQRFTAPLRARKGDTAYKFRCIAAQSMTQYGLLCDMLEDDVEGGEWKGTG